MVAARRISATAAAALSLVAISATQGASVVERASAAPGRTELAGLPRVPWEGGATYYRRFPNAHAEGWSKATFFPIGVFLAKPAHARALRQVGINTYVGMERDGTPIATVTSTGMFVLPQRDEWSAAAVGANRRAVGWLVADECEMGLNGCNGNERQSLSIMQSWVAQLRALNDGRFLYANFGNGVLGTFWARNTMRQFVRALDTSSVDKYAYTSPHNAELLADSPHWPRGAAVARSATYGWLAQAHADVPGPEADSSDVGLRRDGEAVPHRAGRPHDHARADRGRGLGCDHERGARHRLLPAQQQRRPVRRTRSSTAGRRCRNRLASVHAKIPAARAGHQHAVVPLGLPQRGRHDAEAGRRVCVRLRVARRRRLDRDEDVQPSPVA